MTATASTQTQQPTVAKSMIAGAIAGLGGGLVFGMMMAVMGKLPMVAMLVGSENAAVGIGVHMAISAAIGAVYGLAAARLPQRVGIAVLAGAVNGFIWWVLGALILMPLMLGMGAMVLQVGEAQWTSLMGHLLYGVAAGLLFLPLHRRI